MKKTIEITIDQVKVHVDEGSTVLQAARQLGIEIPTMCFHEGLEGHTSCMLCMVKNDDSGQLFASCSMPAATGMNIITRDEEIIEARRTALELLLSDHTGDCEAPCQPSCPAHMDIPQMNRLLAAGKFDEAKEVVMRDIPLPSVLGRICSAPCEKACKRNAVDDTVSICLLKRYAGDEGAGVGSRESGQAGIGNDFVVAIVGAGPAGLSAAYYLCDWGYRVRVYDKAAMAGGELRNPELFDRLPAEVLNKEIKLIEDKGVDFLFDQEISKDHIQSFSEKYDAVIVATGTATEPDDKNSEGNKPLLPDAANVFLVGSPYRQTNMAVRAVGKGKDAAFRVDQFLNDEEIIGEPRKFNSRFGKLTAPEFDEYLKESNSDKRIEPDDPVNKGFTKEEVMKEAARCLHCDCRKLDNCKLRDYSEEYKANQRRYKSDERQLVTKQIHHNVVIYEPAKCIKCGICVRITRKYQEKYGFTYIGRGFDVQVQVPFRENLAEGLKETAHQVAEACPTGAISPHLPRPQIKI